MTWLIINLLIAHVLGDFYCQTESSCDNKFLKSYKGKELWIHAGIIGVLSGIAVWDVCFWAWALFLFIMVTHFLIDWGKAWAQEKFHILLKKENNGNLTIEDGENNRKNLWAFLADQILHIVVIIVGAYFYIHYHEINNRVWVGCQCVHCFFVSHSFWVKISLAMLLAVKPVNVLVLLILKFYTVNTSDTFKERNNKNVTVQINGEIVDNKSVTVQINGEIVDSTKGTESEKEKKGDKKQEDEHGKFHSGKLIGYLERCLILIFVVLSQYEAIGFLIAAKSILRFGEASSGTEKSEYVLAGTLLSLAFALLLGILVIKIPL